VQYAFQAAKAYVTGEPPRPGEEQHRASAALAVGELELRLQRRE
jgi:hypothetical protein